MWLVLASLASAGPSRCVATWSGPAPGCAIRGEVVASAAALSEKAARRALQIELDAATVRAVASTRAQVATLDAAQFVSCGATVPPAAFVNCFEDPALAQPAFCFVALGDRTCWSGDVLQVEAVGWQAHRLGRERMCAAVDAHLVTQNYTNLDARRAICAYTCAASTTVSCPAQ